MSTLSHITPWNASPPNYETQYTTMTLTPYLQLPHLLSLTWLAYPILSLLFVAFRLQLSLAAAQDTVASAKDDFLTSCSAAEQAATSTASMPRLLAIATNKQFADAVNGTLDGARFVLTTSLTVMEAVVNFLIDLYRSTLLCFLELVVRGGLSILIGAVQELNNVIQSAASSLRTSIQSDIASANNVIKDFIDTVNKINPFKDIQAPQITVPSLDGLANLTLPSSFEDNLTKLNASLPTVADLKDKVESIIDTPFELLKKEINDTFSEISFDSSVMPIPAQNRLSFCNDMDTSIIDDIGQDLIKTAKIGIVVLIILALILIGLNCLLTWYKWHCLKTHLEYTRQAWLTDPTMYHTRTSAGMPQMTLTDHNLLMLQANSSHPFITRITNRLSQLLRLTPSQHTYMQWFFHYVFHPPAAAVFLIGFFGLLCVELQLLAMGPLISRYQDRAATTVSDFSNTIATSINNSMYNQSAAYANEVNARIDAVQTTLNDGLFGWVNQTTTTLNATVSEFYADIENAVNSVFGNTILQEPAQEFLRCFIGSKVDAIENVLTFLHDNLHVNMPRMNDSALVVSQGTVNEAVQPIAAAAIGGGSNDRDSLIGKIINSYADSLRKERIMFCVFLGLWGLVVLMGIGIILWHSHGRRIVENRRRKRWMNQRNQGLDSLAVSLRGSDTASVNIKGHLSSTNELPSFIDIRLDSGENWEIDPAENQVKHEVEQKKGFMTFVKEKIVPRKAPPPFVPTEQKDQRSWFDKMITVIGKKEQQGTFTEERSIGEPELKFTSFDFADASREGENESLITAVDEPKSRWSKSTTQAQTQTPTSILSKSAIFSPSATSPSVSFEIPHPSKFSQPDRPSILPPQPHQPKQVGGINSADTRHGEDVCDGFSSQSQARLQQSSVPIPLYYGFENENSRYPVPLSRGRYPQTSSPVPPSRTPDAPKHHLSISFPSMNQGNKAGVGTGANIAPPSAARSLERLLTGSYALQSDPFNNMFISPFDDEHRVKIDVPATTRKSVSTNPSGGVAV